MESICQTPTRSIGIQTRDYRPGTVTRRRLRLTQRRRDLVPVAAVGETGVDVVVNKTVDFIKVSL